MPEVDGGAEEIATPPPEINIPVEEPGTPDEKPKNSVENSEPPNIAPKFPERIYGEEKKGPGRQRKKSGVSQKSGQDGVREMFFLWFDEGNGRSFGSFYANDLSDDMCDDTWGYYPKHFIYVRGKFHGEYLQYRREYRQKFGRKFGSVRDTTDTHGSKILPFRENRA